MYEFKLPDLGEGIHEGEILKWYVKPGDPIEEDAPLVDVETDKAAVTLPSPRSGVLVSTTGAPGDVVTVGDIIAVVDDGSAAAVSPAAVSPSEVSVAAVSPGAVSPSVPRDLGRRPVPAAPATRRLARERGVDIDVVPATGPAGRVTREDVERFAASDVSAPVVPPSVSRSSALPTRDEPAPSSVVGIPLLDITPLPDFSEEGPVEKEALRSIRRKVARKMVTSAVLVPQVAHMDDADVTELEALRRERRERYEGRPGGRLTLLPFVMKAVMGTLREERFRKFNASLDGLREEIVTKRYINLGFASDTPKGLVVPVVHGADRESLLGLSARIEELARRARDGSIEAADMRGGTFTVTNIGAIGGTYATPLVNYPEVAILATGRLQERPVVRSGGIVTRKILPITLAFDHRLIDGAEAARFVSEVMRRLGDPVGLLMEA